MSHQRKKPQNPLGLSPYEQRRLIAFHEAGHVVVGATLGQAVVRVELKGADPQVELTPSNDEEYGFLAELAVLCGGFTAVEAGFPGGKEALYRDGAQNDIGRVEDMGRTLVHGVCEEGLEEARKLARFLNRFASRHPDLGADRFTFPPESITAEMLPAESVDWAGTWLLRLLIFIAKAEAKARLSSKGGRTALHQAAQYFLEKGPKSAATLNRKVAKALRKEDDVEAQVEGPEDEEG